MAASHKMQPLIINDSGIGRYKKNKHCKAKSLEEIPRLMCSRRENIRALQTKLTFNASQACRN